MVHTEHIIQCGLRVASACKFSGLLQKVCVRRLHVVIVAVVVNKNVRMSLKVLRDLDV